MGEVVREEGDSGDDMNMMSINPQDAWLPITESRKGNVYTSTFLVMCSGLGIQALMLPLAFIPLGWFWGIICLSIAFVWQLYTIWLLVHLHESANGTRYSRYLHLAIVAFGEKLGKLLGIFPVMYLSGGTCVMLIINGGGIMELLYQTMTCEPTCNATKTLLLSGAEWFLVFTCLAIFMALFFPNLNSVALASLIGAITAVGYLTLMWILSISKGQQPEEGVSYHSYDPSKNKMATSEMGRVRDTLNAFGIIALAFRGHNLVLEIQGTIASNTKHPSHEKMWKGVTASYLLVAVCLFPLAVGGYWAYGNSSTVSNNISFANGGLLNTLPKNHGHDTSKFVMGIIYLLVVINSLCSFQIYAMPVFDNLERVYTSKKNKPCSRWLRSGFRICFGGLTFFISVALPFLPSLAALIGGLTLPLTFAYPCFMWIAIKKVQPKTAMWSLNLGLGCLGIVLSVLLVIAALWNLVCNGLDANFFNPH